MMDLTHDRTVLRRDLARAGLCLLLFAPPLALDLMWWAAAACLLGTALAVAFAAATLRRMAARYRVDGDGLRTLGPSARSIRWDDVDRLKLRHYGGRRGTGPGWWELTLKAGKTAIRIDSSLDRFDRIVVTGVAAARRNAVAFDADTAANLDAFGMTELAMSGAPS